MQRVVHIDWYATVLRQDALAQEIVRAAPLALRYGATRYAVHRSGDDRYKITQMAWFDSERDWYRYWEGPEMIEFRRRNAGKFQLHIVYVWHEELIAGELGPEVALNGEREPAPAPEPQAAT